MEFLSAGPSRITALYLPSRVLERLLGALGQQTQLTTLQVKWGDYADLGVLSGVQHLTRLRLRGASRVTNLSPVAAVQSVVTSKSKASVA